MSWTSRPSGAGKTTTIRMLNTLLKPMAGRVTVFGTDAAPHPMRVRRMIGYVPQLLSADAPPAIARRLAIFYGIQIIWERDAGVLTKLMVTPTPRAALITGKALAAGVR